MFDRIIYRMKVTAIIPDHLIEEVKEMSGAKNITESLIIALQEWTEMKQVKRLNAEIEKQPLSFQQNFDAHAVRETNQTFTKRRSGPLTQN